MFLIHTKAATGLSSDFDMLDSVTIYSYKSDPDESIIRFSVISADCLQLKCFRYVHWSTP